MYRRKDLKCSRCGAECSYTFRRWDEVVLCSCGKALSVHDEAPRHDHNIYVEQNVQEKENAV